MPLKIAIAACGLFGLVSCHKPGEDPQTLHVLIEAPPQTLDPRKAIDANGMRIAGLLFNGFVKLGPKLEPIADGAESWRRRGLSYEFLLRELVFSNGRKATAEDVQFSLHEFFKKESFFHGAFKNVASFHVFEREGRIRTKIQLKKPSAIFLSSNLPVVKILPRRESAGKGFHKEPIGSGPFHVEKNFSHKILLKRRQPLPRHPSHISFSIVRDSFTRLQKMLSGEGDIAPSTIPFSKIHFLKEKGFHLLERPSLSTTYLLLNFKNEHLKRLKIRKALSRLIQREKIIRLGLRSFALPAAGLLSPESRFFSLQAPPPAYDLEKSRALFPGPPVELSFHCSNSPRAKDLAKILVSDIQKGNFRLQLRSKEWGAFYQDISRGLFDIALMKWVGIVDPDIYRLALHSKASPPSGRNRGFYSNPSLDSLLDRGLETESFKERFALYSQVQRLAAKDLAILPLWHEKEVSVVKRGIEGYALPENGDFSSLAHVRKKAPQP